MELVFAEGLELVGAGLCRGVAPLFLQPASSRTQPCGELCLGSFILDLGSWLLCVGSWILNLRSWVPCLESWVPGAVSWTKNWSKCWGWLVSLVVLAHRNGLRELAAGRCSCCCPHTPAQICRFPSGDSRLGTKNWSRNIPMVCVPHVPRTAARVALSAGEARCADELRAPSNGDDDILCRYARDLFSSLLLTRF